jgi:hypothetical protein
MAAVTQSSGYSNYSRSVLQRLKGMDLINELEIADGLKQLLLSKDFPLELLLNTSASDLAKILGIDECIAKIVRGAIKATANLVIEPTNQSILDSSRVTRPGEEIYFDRMLKSLMD